MLLTEPLPLLMLEKSPLESAQVCRGSRRGFRNACCVAVMPTMVK